MKYGSIVNTPSQCTDSVEVMRARIAQAKKIEDQKKARQDEELRAGRKELPPVLQKGHLFFNPTRFSSWTAAAEMARA